MKYTVHYSGYYGYDVNVEANDEEEARRLADEIFDNTDANKFLFEAEEVDVTEN